MGKPIDFRLHATVLSSSPARRSSMPIHINLTDWLTERRKLAYRQDYFLLKKYPGADPESAKRREGYCLGASLHWINTYMKNANALKSEARAEDVRDQAWLARELVEERFHQPNPLQEQLDRLKAVAFMRKVQLHKVKAEEPDWEAKRAELAARVRRGVIRRAEAEQELELRMACFSSMLHRAAKKYLEAGRDLDTDAIMPGLTVDGVKMTLKTKDLLQEYKLAAIKAKEGPLQGGCGMSEAQFLEEHGYYLYNLKKTRGDDGGHSMAVYVSKSKNGPHVYFFDPNVGVFRFSKDKEAQEFFSALPKAYVKDDLKSMAYSFWQMFKVQFSG
jgi:hypothetical protein